MFSRSNRRQLVAGAQWRPSVDEEVEEELALHLELRTRQYQDRGMDPRAAREAAMRRFGDMAAVRRACRTIGQQRERDMKRAEWLQDLGQDIRYALRTLRSQPGFTFIAVLTLALGIGASTAIFGVVRGVLLRPLPFPEADRLVQLWQASPQLGVSDAPLDAPTFEDYRRENRTFQSLAGFRPEEDGLALTGRDVPERLYTAYVTEDFFRVLGVRAAIGRLLLPEENAVGNDGVVVLSHDAWRRRFGGDPTVVGSVLQLSGRAFTVVGVMEPGVRFPHEDVALWVPVSIIPDPDGIPRTRDTPFLSVIGRIRPGVTMDQARADLTTLAGRVAAAEPATHANWNAVTVRSLHETIVGDVRAPLLVLLAAVVIVVLIACVNVANLLLARTTARDREFAVRAALGAPRMRVIRQVLTESIVLALIAGIAGVALAWWGQAALVRLSGEHMPRAADVRVDGLVMAFAFGLSLVTGIAFGLVPALRSGSGSLSGRLRDGGRSASAGASTLRARDVLVAAEVALAIVLVVGAGLMVQSFTRLMNVNPGFDAQRTLVARFTMPMDRDSTTMLLYLRTGELIEAVRAVPGVTSASQIKGAPLLGAGEPRTYWMAGQDQPPEGHEPRAQMYPIAPDYFRTMGIPLLAGREFEPGDTLSSALKIIISESVARRHWNRAEVVGEELVLFGSARFTVIGVAGDVRTTGLDTPPEPTLYIPRRFMPRVSVSLVLRTEGDPVALIPAVRRAIQAAHPALPITAITPMRSVVSESLTTPRLLTALMAAFGVLALLVAVVGLYGVVSFLVSQRKNEIGIRMALGAQSSEVVRLMLWRGMLPVLAGSAVGIVLALVATRLLQSLLFGVSATDPLTFVAVPLALLTAAIVAAFIPARRAAHVDPVHVLGQE